MRTRRQRNMRNFGTNSASAMSDAKGELKVQKKLEGGLETDKPEPAAVTKKTHNIRFMDHCFFCVRKTTTKDYKERNCSTDLVDKLVEVPSADDSLSLDTSLLCTLNKTWAYLLQGGNWNWASDSTNMIAQFTRLPKMCRFCAEELVTISRLMCELIAEINRLGKVMRDSRYGGVHSWRVDRFEQTLKNSGVDWDSISDTLRFLGKPDIKETVLSTNSQPDHENIDQVEVEAQREGNSDDNDGDGGMKSDSSHDDPSYIQEEPTCSSENEDPDDAVEEDQEEYEAGLNDNEDTKAEGSSVVVNNYLTTFDPVTGKRMFQCTINNCGQKYAKIHPTLKQHQRMIHNFHDLRRPCDLCKALVPPEELIDHVRSHVGDDYLLKCPNSDCSHLAFCTISGLSKHRKLTKCCKKSTPVGEWEKFVSLKQTCELCDGKDFETIRVLRHHILNFHESDEKIFPCPIQTCQKKFSVKQSVFLHLALHDEDNDIYPEPVQNCDVCQVKVNLEEVERHLKDTHSLKDVVKCVFCPFLFASRENLVEHVYLHRHSCELYCDICGADNGPTFPVHAELRQHYFQAHQIGSLYNCELCPAQHYSSWALQQHMNNQHIAVNDCSDPNKADSANEKLGAPQQGSRGLVLKFACKEPGCRKFFIRKVNLNRHIASAHNNNGEKKYFCEKCGKSFANNRSLTIHLKWHQGKVVVRRYQFKCQVPGCDKIVSNKSLLAQHVAVKHNREKPHVCNECGKAYAGKTSLRLHVETVHLNLHSTVCDICGEGFTHKRQLENHKWSHTDERPFSCHICGKGFRQKFGLKEHLKLAKCFPGSYDKHRKKTFTCPVPGCGREFLRGDRLQEHVSWVHDEEKSNVCDQCGKAFETKMALKTHVQSVHLGVRNHVCDVCGESFSYGSVLKHHKLIHTGDRPFACQICGQKFRHKEVLKKHLEGHERKGAQFKPNGPMKQVRKRVVKKQNP